MKIAIIGHGYVGKTYEKFFKNNYEIVIYDHPFSKKANNINPIYEEIQKKINTECTLSVICVPTPMGENGECDIFQVEKSVEWLKTPLIVIKSTVSPKTTEKLSKKYKKPLCFSPEFVGESRYFIAPWKYPDPQNALSHGFFIIGGQEPERTRITDIFLSCMGPDTQVLKCTSTEAEIIKYMVNCFGAMKVTFCNEFYEICKAFEADYHIVREGFTMPGWVEKMHTMVNPENRGFGGKCFPKDLSAIIIESQNQGYSPEFLKSIQTANRIFRKVLL